MPSRILFIRVSAETYDEKDLPKAWPKLCALAWPDTETGASSKKLLPALTPDAKRGVLQLVDALVEHIRFGLMPESMRKALQESAASLESLRADLDEALGDRDVPKASGLAGRIEDALDAAEQFL